MHRWLVLMGAPGHASGLFENPHFVGFHKVKKIMADIGGVYVVIGLLGAAWLIYSA